MYRLALSLFSSPSLFLASQHLHLQIICILITFQNIYFSLFFAFTGKEIEKKVFEFILNNMICF